MPMILRWGNVIPTHLLFHRLLLHEALWFTPRYPSNYRQGVPMDSKPFQTKQVASLDLNSYRAENVCGECSKQLEAAAGLSPLFAGHFLNLIACLLHFGALVLCFFDQLLVFIVPLSLLIARLLCSLVSFFVCLHAWSAPASICSFKCQCRSSRESSLRVTAVTTVNRYWMLRKSPF